MCLGIPGRIVDVVAVDNLMATVDTLSVRRQIDIACIVAEDRPPSPCIGDRILLHVRFARAVSAPEAAE